MLTCKTQQLQAASKMSTAGLRRASAAQGNLTWVLEPEAACCALLDSRPEKSFLRPHIRTLNHRGRRCKPKSKKVVPCHGETHLPPPQKPLRPCLTVRSTPCAMIGNHHMCANRIKSHQPPCDLLQCFTTCSSSRGVTDTSARSHRRRYSNKRTSNSQKRTMEPRTKTGQLQPARRKT
jgi:hypothetical protein